jgi:hypothetical protein
LPANPRKRHSVSVDSGSICVREDLELQKLRHLAGKNISELTVEDTQVVSDYILKNCTYRMYASNFF